MKRMPNRRRLFFHTIGKALACLLCLSGVFGANHGYAEMKLHLSNEFSLTSNDITGPGKASSSLTKGVSYLNVLSVSGMGTMKQFDYNFNIGAKSTDDFRNDLKIHSLTNLQARITDKIHTINLGDTFESFSQYSLSTAVKGGSYRYFNQAMKLPEITLVYGLAYPRWDNVWRDDETKIVERQVFGARIKQSFTEDLWAGLSAVRSNDDRRVRDSDPLYRNQLYSLDMEYRPIPGLTVSGELAFNKTDASEQKGADFNESRGYAVKISAIGDQDPSRVTLEYERVTPDFQTFLGSATPDREKFKARWRYKYSKTVTINTGFLWFRNDLEGKRADGRTDHYKPDLGVTFKKLFGRTYSTADISYKLNVSENGTSKTDHIINLNYRDKFGFVDSDTNIGYTSYETRGRTRDRRNEFTSNIALNSRHTVGEFIFSPALYLGSWRGRNLLEDQSDIIYEYSFGMGIDVPKLKINSNVKIGQNKLEKDVGDDSKKIFANLNIFYRPTFLEKLNQGMFFLRAYINDFKFTTGSRDFRETSITAGLNIEL